MINTMQEMKSLTHDLSISTWTLAAVGALFTSGLAEELREPRTLDELAARRPGWPRGRIQRILDVATLSGAVVAEGGKHRLAEGAACFAAPPMRTSMIGDVRSTLLQAVALLDRAANQDFGGGWSHADPALLQAQGDASSGLAGAFKMIIGPQLEGLAARLEQPGVRFLDVGVGVAALAIGMCRAFPTVSVVGVDAAEAPLAIARDRVAKAGLADRVELRRASIEDLADDQAFDLAWLPSFFITESALPRALARLHTSLREGGWIVMGTCATKSADPRVRANFALLNDLWGGPLLDAEQAEKLLKDAGFSAVRVVNGPPSAPMLIAGRR
ncbi:MAG TPA: class I SAM-dependent methyltransferase [Labilithrix sp.]